MITHETRRLSYKDIMTKTNIRYSQILEVLGNNEMTAKEIAVKLYNLGITDSPERNYVAPRATELVKFGIIKTVGKKKCDWTGKQVAVYKLKGEE